MNKQTLENAIYSWWLHPIAVNDGPVTWVGSIAKMGTRRIHRVERCIQPIKLGGQTLPDDHNGVAIVLNPNQPELFGFAARHNHETFLRYWQVNRETSEVGPERRIYFPGTTTYVQILQRGDTLHVITRSVEGSNSWVYRTSDDWGETWSDVKVLVNYGGHSKPYLFTKPDKANPDLVHMTFSGHPTISELRETLYAQLDLATGVISRLDGLQLGNINNNPNIDPNDFSLALQPGPDVRTRVLDIGSLGGQPAIAYARWVGSLGEPLYRVQTYNGSSFTRAAWEIPSGETFGYKPTTRYLRGIALGRQDDHVYTIRENMSNGKSILERWVWDGNDLVFSKTLSSTSDSLARPYAVVGEGVGELVYQHIKSYATENTGNYSANLYLRNRCA